MSTPFVKVNSDANAIWWCGGLQVDADGAPNAYGSDDKGLDFLANAGHPGNWWGLVTGPDGGPLVQLSTDPCPGFYISTTSLVDHSRAVSDPRRYVDSVAISYISLAGDLVRSHALAIGDVALVYCHSTGKASAAIAADVGPAGKYGEGSICLAERLGLSSSPKHGGCDAGVTVVVFPKSSRGWPRTNEDVADQVQELVNAAGGWEQWLT